MINVLFNVTESQLAMAEVKMAVVDDDVIESVCSMMTGGKDYIEKYYKKESDIMRGKTGLILTGAGFTIVCGTNPKNNKSVVNKMLRDVFESGKLDITNSLYIYIPSVVIENKLTVDE